MSIVTKRNILEKINTRMIQNLKLTEMFKTMIKDENPTLYDTGALWRSVKIYDSIFGNSLAIDIRCEEYIVYHIKSYRLVERFTSKKLFKDEVAILFKPVIEKSIEGLLNEGKDFNINPKVTIYFNGE
jgi:hypothetical protein